MVSAWSTYGPLSKISKATRASVRRSSPSKTCLSHGTCISSTKKIYRTSTSKGAKWTSRRNQLSIKDTTMCSDRGSWNTTWNRMRIWKSSKVIMIGRIGVVRWGELSDLRNGSKRYLNDLQFVEAFLEIFFSQYFLNLLKCQQFFIYITTFLDGSPSCWLYIYITNFFWIRYHLFTISLKSSIIFQ